MLELHVNIGPALLIVSVAEASDIKIKRVQNNLLVWAAWLGTFGN